MGKIVLSLNGVAIDLDTRFVSARNSHKPFSKTYTVKLPKGENIISVKAFDRTNSVESELATYKVNSTVKRKVKSNIYALVIGIQEYRNSSFNLANTKADADIVSEVLKQQRHNGLFNEVFVTKLVTKEETSKENILRTLKSFSHINPNDLFVFYVGSHGIVDSDSYYLIPSNVGSTSIRKLKTDAISEEELKVALSNVKTSKKMIVLDTCHAGKMGEVLATRSMSQSTAINILSRAIGTTIFSSSSSKQESIEGYKGHGLFTYLFVQGLKKEADTNKDGFVKTLELADYLDDIVPKVSMEKFKHEQFPTTNPMGNAFPVSVTIQ